MVITRSVRGMNDIFSQELELWHDIESQFFKICEKFYFKEIRTPILEDLSLFERGIGAGTDIVEKEMFVVPDSDHKYVLRPENTASVVRALMQKGGLSKESEEKLCYLGPMFRKERPQRGRLRQFHQFGLELFGIADPIADVEILLLVHNFLLNLGLDNIILEINSLGNTQERDKYKQILLDYVSKYEQDLCQDCQRRIGLNILRVLDCKNNSCKNILVNSPTNLDILEPESQKHFDFILDKLSYFNINYSINKNLVRGLDYYERTVFEFVAPEGLGAQNAVVAGGRYDKLFSQLGNKFDIPAIGCAGGIERLIILLESIKTKIINKKNKRLVLISADDLGWDYMYKLCANLRNLNIICDFSLVKKSVKAQMRRANKICADYVLVIGSKEIAEKKAVLKSLGDAPDKHVKLCERELADILRVCK